MNIGEFKAAIDDAVVAYRHDSASDYRAAAVALIRIAAGLVRRIEFEDCEHMLPEVADREAMERFVAWARAHHDGHFTLMRFTTNWRACFGTIDGRDEIESMPSGSTMAEAIDAALKSDL